MIVKPEKQITDTVAIITANGNEVFIKFTEHNDKFREVVKTNSFYWNELYFCWYRKAKNVLYRVAQTGRELLEAGIIVDFPSEESVKSAIEKLYTEEPLGSVSVQDGQFVVKWRYGYSLYEKAIRIKGAKYCKPFVCIPKQRYREVLDFAEYHQYEVSEKAKSLANQACNDFEAAITFVKTEMVKPTDNFNVLLDLID